MRGSGCYVLLRKISAIFDWEKIGNSGLGVHTLEKEKTYSTEHFPFELLRLQEANDAINAIAN